MKAQDHFYLGLVFFGVMLIYSFALGIKIVLLFSATKPWRMRMIIDLVISTALFAVLTIGTSTILYMLAAVIAGVVGAFARLAKKGEVYIRIQRVKQI